MVKNWADHCSSDEEDNNSLDAEDASLDGNKQAPVDQQQQQLEHQASPVKNEGVGGDVFDQPPQDAKGGHEAPMPSPGPRTYQMPTEPPYTLYVGNLAYTVLDGGQLAHELVEMANHVLNFHIKVMEVRIIMDRNAPPDRPRHRGFAYVQLETLEMLEALLHLNEMPEIQLFGRKIQFDTSVQPQGGRRGHQRNRNSFRSGGGGNQNLPDGSSFRGGKFSNRQQGEEGAPQQPRERTSLRLAPRTKPLAEDRGSTQSNIFGQGKARDEEEYEKRKSSIAAADAERAAKEAAAAVEAEKAEKEAKQQQQQQQQESNHQQNKNGKDEVPQEKDAGQSPTKQDGDVSKEQSQQHHHNHRHSTDRRSSGRGGRGRGEFSARGRSGRGLDGNEQHHNHGGETNDQQRRSSSGRGGRGRGNYDRRSSSGRGGRGRGGRRDGSFQQQQQRDGGGDHHHKRGDLNTNKPQENGSKPEPKPQQPVAKVVPPGKVATAETDKKSNKAATKAVSNKFAALGFDSDSD